MGRDPGRWRSSSRAPRAAGRCRRSWGAAPRPGSRARRRSRGWGARSARGSSSVFLRSVELTSEASRALACTPLGRRLPVSEGSGGVVGERRELGAGGEAELRETLRRWKSTVRGLTKSRAATSLLDRPCRTKPRHLRLLRREAGGDEPLAAARGLARGPQLLPGPLRPRRRAEAPRRCRAPHAAEHGRRCGGGAAAGARRARAGCGRGRDPGRAGVPFQRQAQAPPPRRPRRARPGRGATTARAQARSVPSAKASSSARQSAARSRRPARSAVSRRSTAVSHRASGRSICSRWSSAVAGATSGCSAAAQWCSPATIDVTAPRGGCCSSAASRSARAAAPAGRRGARRRPRARRAGRRPARRGRGCGRAAAPRGPSRPPSLQAPVAMRKTTPRVSACSIMFTAPASRAAGAGGRAARSRARRRPGAWSRWPGWVQQGRRLGPDREVPRARAGRSRPPPSRRGALR